MFKKYLPFAVFLATLIAFMALLDGGFVLLNKRDVRNAERMLTLLAQGKVEETNRSLTSIIFLYKIDYYYESPFSEKYLHSLAACLGESEIAIIDTVDLQRHLKRIEAWPQALKTYTKLKFWQAFTKRLPNKERYQAMNHFREIMRWDQSDKKQMKSFFAKSHFFKFISDSEPILVGMPLVVTIVQFSLIGPILLIALLWEWRLERRQPSGEEAFSTFALSSRQKYLTLGIYLLALALTFLTAFLDLRGQPFTSAISTSIYLCSLTSCIALILPLTIFVILKLDIRRMRKGNGITDRPQQGVVLISWVKQYKFFLWRLWLVWLLSGLAAGLLMKLYSGYQVDLYGLYGVVKPW